MREVSAVVGGELSGHYYFQLKDKHFHYTDSALVANIRLLNPLSSGDMPMSGHIGPPFTGPLPGLTLEGRTRADRDVNDARVLKFLERHGHVASSAQ